MKRELDMTGSTRIKLINGEDTREPSLCERCAYPLVKCQWLLGGRPFQGSEYIEKKVHYYGEVVYSTYVITACPHYKEEK